MVKAEFIRARVNEELKANTEVLFSRLGLTMTDAITLFLVQCQLRQGLPFDVRIPNAETIAAIEEVQEMKRNPHLHKGFDSVDALFEELNSDDD